MKWLRKKMNKKGFSLIELIVVIAILAIIAAIAIPRFVIIMANSEVKSDAATAAEICNAARVYEVETGNVADFDALDPDYIETPTSQSASAGFTLSVVLGKYTVTFTPDNDSSYNTLQTITENEEPVVVNPVVNP